MIPDIKLLKRYKKNEKIEHQLKIYLLYFKENVVYVGQTENIVNRIREHKMDKTKYFDSYSFFPVNSKFDADICEFYLINKYSPAFNHNNGVMGKILENRDFLEKHNFKKIGNMICYNKDEHLYNWNPKKLYDIIENEYDVFSKKLSDEEIYENEFKGLNLLDEIKGENLTQRMYIERLIDLIRLISLCENCNNTIDSDGLRFFIGLCSNCLIDKYKDEIMFLC